jgi:hypothetical protein
MQLIARRSMYYGVRRLKAGDTFEAEDRHGRLLVLARACMEAPQPVPPAEEPAEEEPTEQPEEPPRAKRKYTRRDLRAES